MAAVSREAEVPVALQAQVGLQAQVALQAQVVAARPSIARSINRGQTKVPLIKGETCAPRSATPFVLIGAAQTAQW